MKKENKQLLLLTLLALLLRCWFIWSRNIQYDDAFSILLSQLNFQDIVTGTAADTMPPMYYFILHLWSVVFTSIWWFRLLSIFCSIAALLLLFFIVRAFIGLKAAMWALFFGAISPFQIYHAQDIRMYALLQLFQMVYLFAFYKLTFASKKTTSRGIWIVFVVSGACSLYTHNLAAFFLILPNVFLVFTKKWSKLMQIIFAQVIIALLFLPWIFFVPGQIEKIQAAFWTPKPGLLEIIQAIAIMTTSLTLDGILLYVVVALSISTFLLVIYLLIKSSFTGNMFDGFLIIFTFGVPILLFFISYIMRPVFVPRAFLSSSLLYFGVVGSLISRDIWKSLKITVIIGIALSSILSLPNFYSFASFPRSPFRTAAMYTAQNQNNSEVVIHDNKLSYFPFAIYDTGRNEIFLADEKGSHNDTLAAETQDVLGLEPKPSIEDAVSDYSIIEFVVFDETIKEYMEIGYDNHPAIDRLNQNFQLVSTNKFNDLIIFTYKR